MSKDITLYCSGVCESGRKFSCKRWLGNYSEQKRDEKRIVGTECKETKGQLDFFTTYEEDYFFNKLD
jgi:hypothetical protein